MLTNLTKRLNVTWISALVLLKPGYVSGFQQAKLPMVGFMPASDPFAFGFLDPALVIMAATSSQSSRMDVLRSYFPFFAALGEE